MCGFPKPLQTNFTAASVRKSHIFTEALPHGPTNSAAARITPCIKPILSWNSDFFQVDITLQKVCLHYLKVNWVGPTEVKPVQGRQFDGNQSCSYIKKASNLTVH